MAATWHAQSQHFQTKTSGGNQTARCCVCGKHCQLLSIISTVWWRRHGSTLDPAQLNGDVSRNKNLQRRSHCQRHATHGWVFIRLMLIRHVGPFDGPWMIRKPRHVWGCFHATPVVPNTEVCRVREKPGCKYRRNTEYSSRVVQARFTRTKPTKTMNCHGQRDSNEATPVDRRSCVTWEEKREEIQSVSALHRAF